MESFILLVPVGLMIGQCIVSSCFFRRLSARINSLEERLTTLTLPVYPPPPPTIYPATNTVPYYGPPQGYGYAYSGGQGAQGNLNVI
jgi:hypothetical protein